MDLVVGTFSRNLVYIWASFKRMKSVYKSEKSTCENFENRVGNESFIFKNIKRRRIINDEKQTIACLYINS